MNLLDELSVGKSYSDFLPTRNSTRKSPKMSDRSSPVPPATQGSPFQGEPSRDYDIIDDEAVSTTAHGAASVPCYSGSSRLGLRVLGQVGQSLNTGADKIFRKGTHADEFDDSNNKSRNISAENKDQHDQSGLPGDFDSNRFRSHGNEMEFRAMMHEPEADIPALNLPHVNCPEKIIICIDLATEVNRLPFVTNDGSRQLPLELLKKVLNIFVQIKSAMNPKHEFALVLLQESALWIQDFTGDVDDFVNVLLDMTNDTTECESCDLASLFDVIQEKVQIPYVEDIECMPPPYIIRTLFVYGRSNCIPKLNAGSSNGEYCESQKNLSSSPYFFFDVFYVHEPPTEENLCKEIYDVFLNLDVHNTSYIHEVGREQSKLHEKMAMLIAHPLQRPPQTQCQYNIFTDE